jgi:branched-subunit amino acid transport protein
VSTGLIALAFLLFGATYPSRALPLLAPGIERLPPRALLYLRLVGPAVLASLAAVNVFVVAQPDGAHALHAGVEIVGVGVCMALVAWRRNLFLGLAAGVVVVALVRLAGLA